ncbi:MAG: hypothetical protein PHU62_01575 [Bacteroidales bacterium]|nr:hypothetical protein [Bacteroidales bacterium]MDD3152113.1 hypothetical protein [Bacteroidales bacterium]MDD3913462.1 hypothetical protein [Bacteroidales bacterium]MDD4633258.1 hypothetical protein [Bacteroidales bacterium]
MKRNNIIIISLFSLVLVMLSSCVEEKRQDDLTKRGQEIFNVWNYIISENIENNSNIAFVFNTYLEAANDSVAESIRVNDINNAYIINQDNQENVWLIMDNNVVYYKIITNGKTLSEINAEWNITINRVPYYSCLYGGKKYVKITHNNATTWDISVTNSLNALSYINVAIINPEMFVPSTIFNTDFYMTGCGHIAVEPEFHCDESICDGDNVFMDFNITSTLQHKFYKVFTDGNIDLSVVNSNDERTSTSASFDTKSIYNNFAIITYREVTDTVNLFLRIPEDMKWYPITSYE